MFFNLLKLNFFWIYLNFTLFNSNLPMFDSFSGVRPVEWSHFFIALPEIILTFGLLFLLVLCTIVSKWMTAPIYRKELQNWTYNGVILLLFLCLFFLFNNVYTDPTSYVKSEILENVFLNNEWRVFLLFRKVFIIDYYSSIFKIVIIILSILILYVLKHFVFFTKLIEYPILLGFLILGLILLIESFDLISMYLSLELVALVSYILAAFSTKVIDSVEAGIKYLILGSVASGLILLGISLIYGATGFTDFYFLKYSLRYLEYNNQFSLSFFVGVILINLGFFFKLSAAPFHMWTLDVYEGSPLGSTFVFATLVKLSMFVFYFRLVYFLFSEVFFFPVQGVLAFCCFFSLIWGGFGGLVQTNIKRLLGYSAVTNTGFIFLGLLEGTHIGNTGIYSVLLYVSLYYLANIVVFIFLLVLNNNLSERFDISRNESITELKDLEGLGKRFPLYGFFFSLAFFSLAGIPPLVGFWGKLTVFMAVWKSSFWWLIFVGLIASVVSSFYYLRVVKVMFFDKDKFPKHFKIHFSSKIIFFVWFFLVLLLMLSFFTPAILNFFLDYLLLEHYLYHLYEPFNHYMVELDPNFYDNHVGLESTEIARELVSESDFFYKDE